MNYENRVIKGQSLLGRATQMECHSETREYHSIIHKPIIAPKEHPVCRNTNSKTNRAAEERPVQNQSYRLHCLNEKQKNKSKQQFIESIFATYYAGLTALKYLLFIYPGLHPGLGYVGLSGRRQQTPFHFRPKPLKELLITFVSYLFSSSRTPLFVPLQGIQG